MNKKTMRYLTVSFIFVFILCIFIFLFLALFMTDKSSDAIREIGKFYMSGTNEQISMHFETTIDLRLEQVDALVHTIPPERADDAAKLREDLQFHAQARGFEYLAFYTGDGSFDMIYGESVELMNPDLFLKSMNNKENKVAAAVNAGGDKIVLLGVSANYPLGDGKESIALVAGLSADYIGELLSLDQTNAMAFSHVINKDGVFVIRNGGAFRENYFDRIMNTYLELDGKTAEQYVRELKDAIAVDEDYSSVFRVDEERRYLYASPLPDSEWYLITVMPFGTLDETINDLSAQWVRVVLITCVLILIPLLLIFFGYSRLTRRQFREMEAARQEAVHANKAKSEFLSNMSHDIRTPMNAIVGMTAIATANIDNTQQVQNCLRKISLSGKHLLGLINDVLDMSKIESGKMTLNMDLVSLREVMDSIVSIVQPQVKTKGQQFDVIIRDISEENVCCDSVRLNQVLLNFLSNAIKFTPEGGQIQVLLYEEESPKGESFVRVHLRVKDNGIGMAPEFKEKIFESFTREDSMRVHKTEGTGLGMAITKYIIDTMGGTIEVDSEVGKGTEFHVTLDMEKALEQEIDMVLPDWNMLVVDDDEQLCQSVVESLKNIGVKAEWTLDGETAVEMVEERHRQHNDYHVILLDWKLPGIDGIEAARQIRKRIGDEMPILLISAYDWSEIEDDAKEAGVSGFISKPLFKSTLFYGLRPFAGHKEDGEETSTEESHGLDGRRILLAEDNDLNWEIANELLSAIGLKLERAENGQICVDKFSQSSPGFYDVILMDIDRKSVV